VRCVNRVGVECDRGPVVTGGQRVLDQEDRVLAVDTDGKGAVVDDDDLLQHLIVVFCGREGDLAAVGGERAGRAVAVDQPPGDVAGQPRKPRDQCGREQCLVAGRGRGQHLQRVACGQGARGGAGPVRHVQRQRQAVDQGLDPLPLAAEGERLAAGEVGIRAVDDNLVVVQRIRHRLLGQHQFLRLDEDGRLAQPERGQSQVSVQLDARHLARQQVVAARGGCDALDLVQLDIMGHLEDEPALRQHLRVGAVEIDGLARRVLDEKLRPLVAAVWHSGSTFLSGSRIGEIG